MHQYVCSLEEAATVLRGLKTIDVRLGTPANLKMRIGDELVITTDEDEQTIGSARITQLLYFESLDELVSAVNYRQIDPHATSASHVLQQLRKTMSATDEYEFGVMAITFALSD